MPDEQMITTVLTVDNLPADHFPILALNVTNTAFNSGVFVKLRVIGGQYKQGKIWSVNRIQITFRSKASRELQFIPYIEELIESYNEDIVNNSAWERAVGKKVTLEV